MISFSSIKFKPQPDYSYGTWRFETIDSIYGKEEALLMLENDHDWKIEGTLFSKKGGLILINEVDALYNYASVEEKWDRFTFATEVFNQSSYYLKNCPTS